MRAAHCMDNSHNCQPSFDCDEALLCQIVQAQTPRVQQTSAATASKIEDAFSPLRVLPSDGADQCVPHFAWMAIILCHMHLITLKNCCAKWYRLRRHECIKRSLQLQAMIDAAPRCNKHFAISTVVVLRPSFQCCSKDVT